MAINYNSIEGQYKAGYYCYRNSSSKDQSVLGRVKKARLRARLVRDKATSEWKRRLQDAWNRGTSDAMEAEHNTKNHSQYLGDQDQ